jgi:hypothetical protein
MQRMKYFAVLFIAAVSLAAAQNNAERDRIVSLYKEGAFKQACRAGMLQYYAGNDEPHFAALVGMACAKVDEINPLGALQRNLVQTPALRGTATYFSTLVLVKRLLYQHFIDGTALDGIALPRYDHILSVVFDHVSRGDYKQMAKKMIRIEEGGRSIFVSVSDDEPVRLLVDEYEGAKLLHRHWFQ